MNIVSDRHLRKNKHKSAEPLPTQKKKTQKSHDEPLRATEKPPQATSREKKASHYQHVAIDQGLDMITARSSSIAHKRVACSTRSSKCSTQAEWSYPSTHHWLLAFFRTSAQPLASEWHRCRLPPLPLRFSLGLQATRCKPPFAHQHLLRPHMQGVIPKHTCPRAYHDKPAVDVLCQPFFVDPEAHRLLK